MIGDVEGMRRLARTTLGFMLIILGQAVLAQNYPAKPIRFIIAQAPGGQNDVQARIIGQKLAEALGQPMVYDNRAGAGGQIGFELLAQTPPDGYTIAMGSISTLAVIPMMFNNVITAVPHVKAGKLRALAVTTAVRSPALPEAPTVAESGYLGFESNSWQGIVTRAGTPQAVVARLNSEAVRILTLPEVRNPIASQGNDIAAGSPEEFAAYIRREMEKWGKVIKAARVQGD